MDTLSHILAIMKPSLYNAGGYAIPDTVALQYPPHPGIKCYALLSGDCWLIVEGEPQPVPIRAGDCFVLPRGLPFRLTADLSLEPAVHSEAIARLNLEGEALRLKAGIRYIAGGHFALSGPQAKILLEALPSIVHIRDEAGRSAMLWALDRMRDELHQAQPGAPLIIQHLAHIMLMQALRLHISHAGDIGSGWLSALADKRIGAALTAMHDEPGHPWTVESLARRTGMSRAGFALRFRQIVGKTPLEYLTRWRMLLAADRLENADENLASIASSLGYDSESALGKVFRRVMGHSPRQYSRSAEARRLSAK